MSTMNYAWSILFSCLCSLALPAQAEEVDTLGLVAGNQQVYVHTKPVKRVAIGNPDIAGISMLTTRNIMITGKQVGVTELSIWESEQAAAPAKKNQTGGEYQYCG